MTINLSPFRLEYEDNTGWVSTIDLINIHNCQKHVNTCSHLNTQTQIIYVDMFIYTCKPMNIYIHEQTTEKRTDKGVRQKQTDKQTDRKQPDRQVD